MANYPGGYTGVVLRVNLSTKEIVKQKLDIDLANKYIGGRGLNSKFLYDEIKPGIDPLGPENKVFISTGPCGGTLVPGSQRFTITTKSPLTGFIGDSNSGGDFGAEMKYAGYDMIIVEGHSETPVYLWINDGDVELREASHIWGKTTFETCRAVKKEIHDPEACVISIGPAGENLVRFACLIFNIGRASGRSGTGAVFGSKKLKAIAVRGTGGIKVANYRVLKELARQDQQNWRGDKKAYEVWSKWGPTGGYAFYVRGGMFPTRNFQCGTFETDFLLDLGGYLSKQKGCISCPSACNHSYVIREGQYAGTFGESLENAQLGDLGPRIGNGDLHLALRASSLCDQYGVDVMDMGGMIGFAMDCYEHGILTDNDLGGLKMEWGNAQAILKLFDMITYRKGIGDTLSQGLKKASQIIGKGSENYAMHVKGQTMVMREPRASKGWALAYAISSRGACHQRGAPPEGYHDVMDPILEETIKGYKDPTNPLYEEGKPELVKYHEELRAFQNSMEMCTFTPYNRGTKEDEIPRLEKMVKFYNSVTGNNISSREALHIGERIVNLERAFNLREGLTRNDDKLPERILNEPLPDGPAKGQIVNLEPMIDRFYELREWDKATGIPTRKKLLELDLAEVADELKIN